MTNAPLPGGDATLLDMLRCDQQFTQVCALPNGHNGPHKSIHTLRREEGYDATIDIQRNHLTLARQPGGDATLLDLALVDKYESFYRTSARIEEDGGRCWAKQTADLLRDLKAHLTLARQQVTELQAEAVEEVAHRERIEAELTAHQGSVSHWANRYLLAEADLAVLRAQVTALQQERDAIARESLQAMVRAEAAERQLAEKEQS